MDDSLLAGAQRGWGLAFSHVQQLGERWTHFLRGGYAQDGGSLLQKSISAGFLYQPKSAGDQLGTSSNHDVIRVGVRKGDFLCDYTDPASVRRLFEQTGAFDALISVVGGDSIFKGYGDLVDEDFRFGFERKFLGQVRLVKLGESFARDKGSFTLSSGFLSHYPNEASIATGPLNAAVDTFVQNAAPLLPRNLRLNIVSPAPVVGPGHERQGLITVDQAAEACVNAVEGDFTGEVLRIWDGLPVRGD